MLNVAVPVVNNTSSKFLSCMSSNMKSVKPRTKKSMVSGWLHLLPKSLGLKKNVAVKCTDTGAPYEQRPEPSPKCEQTASPVTMVTVDSPAEKTHKLQVVIPWSAPGYGFTVKPAGRPGLARVGRVKPGGASEAAGLCKGDYILRINGADVSKSSTQVVANLVRKSMPSLTLEILRPNSASSAGSGQSVSCSSKSNRLPKAHNSNSNSEPTPRNSNCHSQPVTGSSKYNRSREVSLDQDCRVPVHNENMPPPCSTRVSTRQDCTQSEKVCSSVKNISAKFLERSLTCSCRESPYCSHGDAKRATSKKRCRHRNKKLNYSHSFTSGYSTSSSFCLRKKSDFGDYPEFPSAQHESIFSNLMYPSNNRVIPGSENTTVLSTARPNTPCSSAAWDPEISVIHSFSDAEYDASCRNTEGLADSIQFCNNNIWQNKCYPDVLNCSVDTSSRLSSCDFDDDCRVTSLENTVSEVVRCEEEFVAAMMQGIHRYARPLRHGVLSQSEYSRLFQNIEKLVALSQYHICQLTRRAFHHQGVQEAGDVSLTDSNLSAEYISSVYRTLIKLQSSAYQCYLGGLPTAMESLSRLSANPDFVSFFQHQETPEFSLLDFLRGPQRHLTDLLCCMRDLFKNTPGLSTSKQQKLFSLLTELEASG